MSAHLGAWLRYGEALDDRQVRFAIDHYAVAVLQPWEIEAAEQIKGARPDLVAALLQVPLLDPRVRGPARSAAPGWGSTRQRKPMSTGSLTGTTVSHPDPVGNLSRPLADGSLGR